MMIQYNSRGKKFKVDTSTKSCRRLLIAKRIWSQLSFLTESVVAGSLVHIFNWKFKMQLPSILGKVMRILEGKIGIIDPQKSG